MDDSNGSNNSTNSNKENYEYVPNINRTDIIHDKRFKNIQKEQQKRNKKIKVILLKEFIL